MRTILMILLLAIIGCAGPAKMYPVSGPLAANPKPIDLDYGSGLWNRGTIKCVMPDGEICEGEYSAASNASMSFGSGLGTATGSGSTLIAQAFGTSMNTGGMSQAIATAYGNRGTILELEVYFSPWDGHGFGAGRDNKGNVYRLHF